MSSSLSSSGNKQQHVAEAALAVVRPHTEPHIRAQASRYLEEWTLTKEAWDIYVAWLEHQMDESFPTNERTGMQLLCLQLLQAKIRRQVPRNNVAVTNSNAPPLSVSVMATLERIHHSLARLMVASLTSSPLENGNKNLPHPALQPACICYAALSVRCGGLAQAVAQATASSNLSLSASVSSVGIMPPQIALRVLMNIPLEVEACSDLTTPQVADELWPFAEQVLATCCHYMTRIMQGGDGKNWELAALATETLECWIVRCRVSLSQLNTPLGSSSTGHNGNTSNGNMVVLPILVHLLSQHRYETEQVPLKASRALTEAILVPTDACSDSRRAAVEALLHAVGARRHSNDTTSGAFLAAPLHFATAQGWDDACHALANVLTTLVTEEVDFCVSQPAEAVLELLLQIQVHPRLKVGCACLECWLTVQEVPVSDRHEHWKAPLFSRVVSILMQRMTYPPDFSSWDDEINVDESDFMEFRLMAKDVLVSSYFLLRVSFVRNFTLAIIQQQQHSWIVQEAALFALTASSREICARIKARGGGVSVGRDREETTHEIIQLAQHLTTNFSGYHQQHWLVLRGACEFMGSYAAAWDTVCAPDAIYQLQKYLCHAMVQVPEVRVPAAKALKQVLSGCAARLTSEPNAGHSVPTCVKECMESILRAQQLDEEAMLHVAEGCTRLVVQLPDDHAAKISLGVLVTPLMQRCEAALHAVMPSNNNPGSSLNSSFSEHASEALEALVKYMKVLQVVIRFCERTLDDGSPCTDNEVTAELMNKIWPLLSAASQNLVSYEPCLKTILAIHEQILKNMPNMVAPRFEATIKYVMNVFESTKDRSAFEYMGSAVEAYGDKNMFDFGYLLDHTFEVLSPHLSSKPLAESCDLIAFFYQLCSRYLLYCPGALAQSKSLPAICSLAVMCLTECKGESESTREALGFLSKFYGWRSLPLPNEAKKALQNQGQRLDEIAMQNGARLIQLCVDMLVGGSQILWASSSDCIFAVVVSSSTVRTGSGQETTIARQWLESAQIKPEHANVYGHVVPLLLKLAEEGPKNRAKAKLLLSDYSNICKGEQSMDALLAYNLPEFD